MNSLVAYFSNRHLLSNIIFFGMLFLGAFGWETIGKEEMPEFESSRIRVTTIYPGAPAEDVELFVTKPMEDELKGVVGIEEVVTTSSQGASSIRVVIDANYPDKKEVAQNVQDAVLRTPLPTEVRDLPKIRQFKSSEKAIIDVGLYNKSARTLDTKAREELQAFVRSFENQLLSKKEISAITRSHYLKPELQLVVDPAKIRKNGISLAKIKSQIEDNHVRSPIGSLSDRGESKVSAINELESVEQFQNLILQGNFEGHGVGMADISSSIRKSHEKSNSIFKINGYEAVFLNVQKSISTDILTAQEVVVEFMDKFKKDNQNTSLGITVMDDESYAVRNRLNIIGLNGLFGFILIIFVLFVFLDVRSGFWVAMGIPFSLGFTLIITSLVGYTVNGMTLAGVIIVLGIVVDDAIIIAENIARKRELGLGRMQASVVGATEVFRPILASIITTCVAFVPLMFFEGFFGKLIKYIPLVVVLMLVGSLLESLFILPSHMSGKTPLLEKFGKKSGRHWFSKVEAHYLRLLKKLFQHRWALISGFAGILVAASFLFSQKMNFVMFPREESKEVFVKVKADKKSTRSDTAKLIGPLEDLIASDVKNVVGVRSSVGLSRRGGEVRENEASILIELHPRDQREESLNTLIDRWKNESGKVKGLTSVKIMRGRWGHGSGNSIELQIQENDDEKRQLVSSLIEKKMKGIDDLVDVELETPIEKNEYILHINQPNLIRLDVDPRAVTDTLRTFVEGSILYSINKGDEEVDVRLTVPDREKLDLKRLLNLQVDNRRGNLVNLSNVIKVKQVTKPVNIVRNNYKRSSMIYANIKDDSRITPMEIAEKLENDIFPSVNSKYPTTILQFKGEIEDSRESQGEFRRSILIVILLVYLILVVMFNSLLRPLLILTIVPFGLAGAIFVLYVHGMSIYGFFAVIGAIGMIGVVINDAIVMLDKMETQVASSNGHPWDTIAEVASSRLRAVLLTTITTAVGILPTAYGFAGYDSMLAEMMLTMGWGLVFGTSITLLLVPTCYTFLYKKQQ